MAKYKAINEQNRCVACGVCVKVCPKDAISIYKGCYAQIDEEKCIGCGSCVKSCHNGAISVRGGTLVTDDGLCDGCGKCCEVCPPEARELCGRHYTVDELMAQLNKDEIHAAGVPL